MNKFEFDDLDDSLDRLHSVFMNAEGVRLDRSLVDPSTLMQVIGENEFNRIVGQTNRYVSLKELDAVCGFVLEFAGVLKGDGDLLGSVSDEVDGFGEFPNIRVLCGLLQPGGDRSAVGHIADRCAERLLSCCHDDSSFPRVSGVIGTSQLSGERTTSDSDSHEERSMS
jgi:hypothetical protein